MKLRSTILGVVVIGLSAFSVGADERLAREKSEKKSSEKSAVKAPVKSAGAAAEKAAEKATEKAAEKAAPGDKDSEKTSSVWMRKKLDYTQNILEGITTGDFELVAQNANAMKGLGKIEVFVRGRTPGYKSQMQVFQEANDEILRQAQKESPEGAALAFTQLTISCINCHKQIREHEAK